MPSAWTWDRIDQKCSRMEKVGMRSPITWILRFLDEWYIGALFVDWCYFHFGNSEIKSISGVPVKGPQTVQVFSKNWWCFGLFAHGIYGTPVQSTIRWFSCQNNTHGFLKIYKTFGYLENPLVWFLVSAESIYWPMIIKWNELWYWNWWQKTGLLWFMWQNISFYLMPLWWCIINPT